LDARERRKEEDRESCTMRHSSPDIITAIKPRTTPWTVNVARKANTRKARSILVEKRKGNAPPGICGRECGNIIKAGLRKIRLKNMDCKSLKDGRNRLRVLVNTVMNIQDL
jgi:hypothetical protein